MAWIQILLSILGGFFVVGFLVWQIILSTKEARLKGLRKNPPRFKNFARTDFTNGFAEGFLIRELPRPNGCHLIEFLPTDVEEVEGKKKAVELQAVVYHKSKLRRFARGSFSGDTEQVWGLPSDITELPEGILSSSLGKYLQEESSYAFLQRTFGNRLKADLDASAKMIEDTTSTGLTRNWLTQREERNKEEQNLASKNFALEQQKKTDEVKS